MTVALTRCTLPLTELTSLVRTIAASPELWQPLLRVPDAGGQRWWVRLSADDRADVWLLSWLPGHATELHDHGPSAAAFSVVRGRLVEVRADARGPHRVRSRHRLGDLARPGCHPRRPRRRTRAVGQHPLVFAAAAADALLHRCRA
jgi:hypothetical protein